MRFWDASAIVPLIVEEPDSELVATLLREDQLMIVSWASRVECVSALRRRERDGALQGTEVAHSLKLLDLLSESWSEVVPGSRVRSAAERVLAVHPLRAADALQLAAAIAWRRGEPAGAPLVCLDERLRDAAARERFEVLPTS